MSELVPRSGERVRELLRMVVKALRDRPIDRVQAQSEVRREHDRSVPLRRIVSIWNSSRSGSVLGCPLKRTGRALRQFPFVSEQVVQVVVVPLGWLCGPCTLQTAGDGVNAFANSK